MNSRFVLVNCDNGGFSRIAQPFHIAAAAKKKGGFVGPRSWVREIRNVPDEISDNELCRLVDVSSFVQHTLPVEFSLLGAGAIIMRQNCE